MNKKVVSILTIATLVLSLGTGTVTASAASNDIATLLQAGGTYTSW